MLRLSRFALLVPAVAAFHVVGDVPREDVLASLAAISERWRGGTIQFPEPPPVSSPGGVYFVDVPGATQSVLRIGQLALAESNPAFYPATVMNFSCMPCSNADCVRGVALLISSASNTFANTGPARNSNSPDFWL